MPENNTPKYWRSLDQLEGTPEFEQFLKQEFPEAAEEAPTGMPRRRWMQLMGASLALATGAAGCRYPEEEVVGFRYPEEEIAPFTRRPDGRIPGKPEKFATTLSVAGKACPVVATSYDGRPIKIDGNQMHPMVAGADTYAQATLLHLYDPDRSQFPVIREGGKQNKRSWNEFVQWWKEQAKKLEGGNSSKLAILHQTNTSPSVLTQMNEVASKFPQAKWYQYESVTGNTTLGTELAFGQKLRALLKLESADIIVDLSADILGGHVTHGVNSQEFAKRRTPEDGPMSRLYVVESRFTTTGISADHRLAIAASQMPSFVADLEQKLDAALENGETKEKPEEKIDIVVTAMVNDLVSHKGKSLVVGGESLDAETQARIWRINNKLENLGQTVTFIEEPNLARDNVGTIEELTSAMNAGDVDTVIFLGGNPIYDAPADVDFNAAMDKTNTQVYYGDYETETSKKCTWHLPASHGLEQWGDAIAYDGSFCVVQPLISPIFETKNPIEFLSVVAGSPVSETLQAVKQTVATQFTGSASEAAWTKVLHDGFISDSAPEAVSVTLNEAMELGNVSVSTWRAGLGKAFELVFHPGAATYDGRFANNGWLQELPEPITKVTWDNVVTMSPKTAEENELKQAELVEISANGKTVTLPVFIQPGQAHGTLAVGLGYGRTHAGAVGGNVEADIAPVGVDVGSLRTKQTMHLATEVSVKGTGKQFKLATTQDHFAIDLLGMREIGRRVEELVREGTVEEYEHHNDFAQHMVHHPPLESLWEEQE